MEDIQKLKNQISVLRSLLREKEEKLRIAEAIEKEKDELWRKEHAPPTKNSDPTITSSPPSSPPAQTN